MVQVAEWPDKYGCDGIDLDLEEGAGARYSKDTDMRLSLIILYSVVRQFM